MGFLSKLIKKPLKDVKKVAKVVAKVDPIARTGMKLDPIARKVTGVGQKKAPPKVAMDAPVVGRTPTQRGYTTGQGNAPAPTPYTPPLRKNTARNSMSTLGSGKYRIK